MFGLEKILNFIIKGGIAFLVIFTPLAFGTVEIWSFAVLQAVCLIVFAAWFSKKIWCSSRVSIIKNGAVKKRQRSYFKSVSFYLRPGMAMFLIRAFTLGFYPRIDKDNYEYYNWYIVAGRKVANTGLEKPVIIILFLILLQVIPLPPGVINAVSPGTYDFYSEFLPGYSEGEVDFSSYISAFSEKTENITSFQFSSWRTISLDPQASIRFLLKLVCYLIIFFVVVNELRDENSRKYFIYLFVFMGLIVAMEGLLQYYHDNTKLLMIRPRPEHNTGAAFGPFINRNHFAGYIEMLLPVTIAMIIELFMKKKEKQKGTFGMNFQNREGKMIYQYERKLTEFYSMAFMGVYALAVMAGAIVIAGSKAGIFLTALSLITMFIFSGMKKAFTVMLIIILASVSIFFAFSSPDSLSAEYDKAMLSSVKTRIIAWDSSIEIFKIFPVLGTGVGSFRVVNSRYIDIGAPWKFHEAHNDYLELLATGGIAITISALLIILFVSGESIRFIRLGIRRTIYQLAFMVSLGAILLHEVVDFNLQIGANAFLFSLIAGLLVGSVSLKETTDK